MFRKHTSKFEIEIIDEDTIKMNDTECLHRVDVCSTRTIFMNDNFVFKFDFLPSKRNSWLLRQSYQEARFYNEKLQEVDKKHFAELLDHGKLKNPLLAKKTIYYVIQKRYYQRETNISKEKSEELNLILTNIESKYNLHDVSDVSERGYVNNAIVDKDENLIIYDSASISEYNYPNV